MTIQILALIFLCPGRPLEGHAKSRVSQMGAEGWGERTELLQAIHKIVLKATLFPVSNGNHMDYPPSLVAMVVLNLLTASIGNYDLGLTRMDHPSWSHSEG